MKIYKKVLTALVCMALAVSVFGCADKDSKSGKSNSDKPKKQTEEVIDTEDDESKDTEEKETKAPEVFTGYTDPTIKMMAAEYEAKDMVVEPIMASDLGASDYNYVDGFRFYAPGKPDAYICWVKFKSADDAKSFVNEVLIKDCKGYIAHEQAGSYYFSIDGRYTGSVMSTGLVELMPYEGDDRKSDAGPEDFKDPKLAALCKDYVDKGFAIEKDKTYNGFRAYGVNDERYHIVDTCIKFKDKDAAVKYVNEILAASSLTKVTLNDNADGSVAVNVTVDPNASPVGSMEGTIDSDGLLVLRSKL